MLRQANSANVGAILVFLLEEHDLLDDVPPQPREHLEAARIVALRHRRLTGYEVERIRSDLAHLGLPLILLKGAAYAMAGLPSGRGRLFSDIDILVPKDSLDDVESALMVHGWASTHHDAYDQRYYRTWMHELPPMVHLRRGNAIDVHHAILPETAPVRPDPALLRAAARPISGDLGALDVCTLSPHDMFLHSAVHLFFGGEFDQGLRDLFDMHRLATHFGAEPGFWDGLVTRAIALELTRPMFYALRYATRTFGTPVPASVMAAAAAFAPTRPVLALMDALFVRALVPPHPDCAARLDGAAHFALYVRGNWLRMPLVLLTRHLFHKAFVSPRAAEAA
nr:nucleotidyltransferase family protein [Massilia aurea]